MLEDEEELPQPTVSGPDAKGILTKVEYYRNDKGEVMKRTVKTRVVKIEKRVFKVSIISPITTIAAYKLLPKLYILIPLRVVIFAVGTRPP